MDETHIAFMQRALDLARQARGTHESESARRRGHCKRWEGYR